MIDMYASLGVPTVNTAGWPPNLGICLCVCVCMYVIFIHDIHTLHLSIIVNNPINNASNAPFSEVNTFYEDKNTYNIFIHILEYIQMPDVCVIIQYKYQRL